MNLIFDGVMPTYQLTHWARRRHGTRPRLPVELIVHKQTRSNAELFGLHDRGSIEAGKRADLNLFDLEGLELGRLEVHDDLPAGGSRILQTARGYRKHLRGRRQDPGKRHRYRSAGQGA